VLFVVIAVIVVVLIFDFTNGFHDSPNPMAGPIATGALKPRTAVILAAVLNLVEACLSTEVAKIILRRLFRRAVSPRRSFSRSWLAPSCGTCSPGCSACRPARPTPCSAG
jgi:phosphate/sulfate permease